jgi:hypothetical protein
VRQRLQENAKAQRESCQKCWARHLCRACLGAAYTEHQALGPIPETVCTRNRTLARATLLALCHLHADSQAWAQLCTHTRSMVRANVARHLRPSISHPPSERGP